MLSVWPEDLLNDPQQQCCLCLLGSVATATYSLRGCKGQLKLVRKAVSGDFPSTDSKLPGSHQHYTVCLAPQFTLIYWFLSYRATQFGFALQTWVQFMGIILGDIVYWVILTLFLKTHFINDHQKYKLFSGDQFVLRGFRCLEILLVIIRFVSPVLWDNLKSMCLSEELSIYPS